VQKYYKKLKYANICAESLLINRKRGIYSCMLAT